MKRKLAILISAGLIIITAAVFLIFRGMQEEPPPAIEPEAKRYVKIDTVHYRQYNPLIHTQGPLKSDKAIDVYAEVSGILERTAPLFKVGNYFNEGQVMLSVDDEEFRTQLYSQKSSFLALLTSIMPDLKADYPDAFPKWKEFLDDFDIRGELSELPEYDSEQEKYFLASRNIFNTYYNLKNLEIRLSKYTIKAPFGGSVAASFIEPGQLIQPGMKLGEFAGTGIYELAASVPMEEAAFLKNGDPAVVYSENGMKWKGRVARIGNNVDKSTSTIKVFIQVSGSGLKNGMFLRAKIEGSPLDSVYRIPRKALAENKYLYFAEDSTLKRTPVRIVFLGENDAYIRGIDSLKLAVTEPLINTPLGSTVIPYSNDQ